MMGDIQKKGLVRIGFSFFFLVESEPLAICHLPNLTFQTNPTQTQKKITSEIDSDTESNLNLSIDDFEVSSANVCQSVSVLTEILIID